MKKILMLLILTISLLVVTIQAEASVTFSLGNVISGTQTTVDATQNKTDTADLNINFFDLTYTGKIKISLEYEFGESKHQNSSLSTHLENLTIGYRIKDEKKSLIYLTAGYLDYTQIEGIEVQGMMVGTDLIYNLTDNIFVEGELNYSMGTYHNYNSNLDLPAELMTIQFKTHFSLNDKFAVVLAYHLIDVNVDNALILSDLSCPSVALVYKF